MEWSRVGLERGSPMMVLQFGIVTRDGSVQPVMIGPNQPISKTWLDRVASAFCSPDRRTTQYHPDAASVKRHAGPTAFQGAEFTHNRYLPPRLNPLPVGGANGLPTEMFRDAHAQRYRQSEPAHFGEHVARPEGTPEADLRRGFGASPVREERSPRPAAEEKLSPNTSELEKENQDPEASRARTSGVNIRLPPHRAMALYDRDRDEMQHYQGYGRPPPISPCSPGVPYHHAHPGEYMHHERVFNHRGGADIRNWMHGGNAAYAPDPEHLRMAFLSRERMMMYRRAQAGATPYSDAFLKSSFPKEQVIAHTDEPDKRFTCICCNKSFSLLIDLKAHEKIHAKRLQHPCKVCKKVFSKKSYLQAHMLTHSGKRPYECDICRKAFRRPHHLKRHKLIHARVSEHHDKQDSHNDKQDSSPSAEQRGAASPCPNETLEWSDDGSEELDSNQAEESDCQAQHWEASAEGEDNGEETSTEHNTPDSSKPSPTSEDDATLKIETDADAEVCEILQSVEKSKAANDPETEETTSLLSCGACGKKFRSLSYLRRHERMHTGEKPFQCSICERGFSQREHLVTHSRTHTGEKPHKCDVCLKSFSSAHNLIMHHRTHTGEKPFECTLCNKAFTQKHSLIRHQHVHTRGGSVSC